MYSLFNNIGKAKNELRNPATVNVINRDVASEQNVNTSKLKRKSGRQYENELSTRQQTPALSKRKNNDLSGLSQLNRNYYALNNTSSTRKKRDIQSFDLADGSSVASSYYANGRRNGGSGQTGLLASSISPSTSSGPMSAPTGGEDGGDGIIIVDPGDDPDPDTMILVGNGMYVMMMLIGLYGAFVFYKRKLN